MLATTIQITNNPPHTTHTNKQQSLAGCAGTHHPTRAADAHTVLNVNPTVCLSAKNLFMPNPKTHPHPPPRPGSKHMQAQENNHAPTKPANTRLFPTKLGSLERR